MKRMEDYLIDGYLVQRNPRSDIYNAVDSNFLNSNHMVWKYYLGKIDNNIDRFFLDFTDQYGALRRFKKNEDFSNESKIWKDRRTVSRDNTIGSIILMHLTQPISARYYVLLYVIMRFGFYQNTRTTKGKRKIPDFAFFESWSILARCFGIKNKFILSILDFFWWISIKVFIHKNTKDPNYNSVLPHMLSSLILFKEIPTKWSKKSEDLILNQTNHCDGYNHEEPVISSLMEYSRASYDPPIYLMASRVIRKMRKEL